MTNRDRSGVGKAVDEVVRALPGEAETIVEARRRLRVAAGADVPVLLLGETGTGKTRAARCLHRVSRRATGPFQAVNCAGVPDSLFESQFFGHRKGAFTGAVADHRGHFVDADGGTLFLDEVGELSGGLQAKLLTAIEDCEIRPVGGGETIPVDIRLVAATAAPGGPVLSGRARGGREGGGLRRDLYHRLAVMVVRLPPLRERLGDLPVVVASILAEMEPRLGRRRLGLRSGCLDVLRDHPWPGNLRELAHLLQTTLLLGGHRLIDPGELRRVLEEERRSNLTSPSAGSLFSAGTLRGGDPAAFPIDHDGGDEESPTGEEDDPG